MLFKSSQKLNPVHAHAPTLAIGNPAALAILLLAGLIPLLFYFWLHDPDLTRENGPLEWLQVVLLIGAVEAHAIHAARLPRSTAGFVLSSGMSALALAFALREIDVMEFGSSEFFRVLEAAVQVIKIAIGVGLLVFVASRLSQLLKSLPGVLKQPLYSISLAAGFLLLFTIPFDDNAFGLHGGLSRFIEEALELASYALLFIAAMTHGPTASQLVNPPLARHADN